jgi:sulfoxide reductase heme-binding subunit YedZ
VPTAWAGLRTGHVGVLVDQWKLVWPTVLDDLKKRRFIQVGLFAWTLLLVLAVTSPAFVMRWMGGKTWRRVHWLVYVAAIAGCVHYWWLVKKGVRAPMPFSIGLAVLLLARVVWNWRKRKPAPAAVARAVTAGD